MLFCNADGRGGIEHAGVGLTNGSLRRHLSVTLAVAVDFDFAR